MNVEEPSKHIPYSIAYIASIFSEIFSKIKNEEPNLTKFRVKSLGTNRLISYEKAKKKLGYIPSFDLRKTAEDMVKWYLKNYS